MKTVQNIAIAFTLILVCFSGCLENDDDKNNNSAPEALILMPRQAAIIEAGKPFTIDGSASTDPDNDGL